MRNKNVQNIMLVTYDPFGIPANVKCESGITNSAGADRIFMDYLQAERDTVLSSGTFPDLRALTGRVRHQISDNSLRDRLTGDRQEHSFLRNLYLELDHVI